MVHWISIPHGGFVNWMDVGSDIILLEDKKIMDKEEFYQWSLNDTQYIRLFSNWESSFHILKLSPSIDRINNALGYTLDNCQWLSQRDNAIKGNR